MRKNTTGQYVAFQAISKTDGSDVITGTPVVYYTIDGGTQAQTTATAVHEGNGQWSIALSQAETNGDHIVFSFVLTGAVTQTVNVYTLDADLTNLDVAVSTRSAFNNASDQVTVSTVNDKTGYSISGVKTTLDDLNDIAASSIVSGGAITTSGGAVSNVTLVATTTTNTDMVDVSGLSTFDASTDQVVASNMRGTDSALLASSAPSNFGSLGINSSGHLSRVTLVDLTTANSDMVSVSGLSTFDATTDTVTTDAASRTASQADLSTLNDITAADVYSYFVTGSNADALKADVSSLASQASVNTVDSVVDAIKAKTDQLTFTTPNSVDATATASVDESAIADAVLAGIGGNDVTISSPVASDGTTITIVRGDDYSASDARSITWTGDSDDQWSDLTDATLKFTAKNNLDSMTITPTVTQPTGSQAFRMELTKDDTEILSGRYKYDVQATLSSGRVITLVVGEMIVKQSYSDTP